MEDAIDFLLKHLRQTGRLSLSEFHNPYESPDQLSRYSWKPTVARPIASKPVLKLTGSSKTSQAPVLDVPSEKDTYHQSFHRTQHSSLKEYLTKVSTYIQPKTKCLRLLENHAELGPQSDQTSFRFEEFGKHLPADHRANQSTQNLLAGTHGPLQKSQNTWSEPGRVSVHHHTGSLFQPSQASAANNFKSHFRFMNGKPGARPELEQSANSKKSSGSRTTSPRPVSSQLGPRTSAPVQPSRLDPRDAPQDAASFAPRRLKLNSVHEKRSSSAFVRIFDTESDDLSEYAKKKRLLEEGLIQFDTVKRDPSGLRLKTKQSFPKIVIQKPHFLGISPLKKQPVFAKPAKLLDSSSCHSPQFAPAGLGRPHNPLGSAFGNQASWPQPDFPREAD